ncbi:hypothetical protein TD95_002825 [Thielaviopsis punctulata]|uniref:Pex N-terminal domain-containing protein n=1 Tax=Thielaviopsis punctulata TaxID=72032 RepID=A0A0F4ZDW8_9PEZI|nr:hypothetical protein TD95_002825 [Thielaviopsis punctulata]
MASSKGPSPSDANTLANPTNFNFLEAQQRIVARRSAREANHIAQISSARDANSIRRHLTQLPGPLSRLTTLYDALTFSSMSPSDSSRLQFRIGQVDAELLDTELVELLRGQVNEGLKYFAGGHLKDDYSAEIGLLLRAALFKLTIWDHSASYGAALQNLQYTDARKYVNGGALVEPSRWQKAAYGAVSVLGSYGWNRWKQWLVVQDNGFDEPAPAVQALARATSAASAVHTVAAFASFLAFLVQGQYRTLLDRVLRMRLVSPSSQISRMVSFEYQNRQLVWHAFTEFLLFVLPLIGISRWKRWLVRLWRRATQLMQSSRNGAADAKAEKKGELAFLPERTCAICYHDQNAAATKTDAMAMSGMSGMIGSASTDITNAYEAVPCGCVYCFVCLATQLEREEGEGWACLRCNTVVTECKPWNGDVLEPVSTVTKTVTFKDEPSEYSEKGYETDNSGHEGTRTVVVPEAEASAESRVWRKEDDDGDEVVDEADEGLIEEDIE